MGWKHLLPLKHIGRQVEKPSANRPPSVHGCRVYRGSQTAVTYRTTARYKEGEVRGPKSATVIYSLLRDSVPVQFIPLVAENANKGRWC